MIPALATDTVCCSITSCSCIHRDLLSKVAIQCFCNEVSKLIQVVNNRDLVTDTICCSTTSCSRSSNSSSLPEQQDKQDLPDLCRSQQQLPNVVSFQLLTMGLHCVCPARLTHRLSHSAYCLKHSADALLHHRLQLNPPQCRQAIIMTIIMTGRHNVTITGSLGNDSTVEQQTVANIQT